MADGGIKVIGLDETIKALQAIGTPTAEIAKAGVESARIVAAEAKTLVPRNTGNLANTIKPSRTKHGSRIVAGGPNAPYGLPIHWGWFRDTKSPRALASPKGYIARNIKPNTFLSRALGYTKQQVVDTYRRNMNQLIERETNKARRGR